MSKNLYLVYLSQIVPVIYHFKKTTGEKTMKQKTNLKSNSNNSPSKTHHVLVVDDEKAVRKVITTILNRFGFDVETCGNAFDAEDMIRRMDFGVIFLDIKLPEKNGVDLLRQAKEIQPDTPVILFTGSPSIETVTSALRLDAFDYLTKPVSPKRLVHVATRAIEMKDLRRKKNRYQKDLENLVTERTEELGASERRYRSLFNDSKDAIIIIDLDGRFVDFNQSALKLFGYSEKEMRRINIQDLYLRPEDRTAYQQIMAKKGAVKDYEIDFKYRDGSILNSLVTTSVRRNNEEAIIGYQGIIHDITARKQAEAKIVEQNKFLTNALESLTHPFYVIDAATYTIKMSNSAANLNQLDEKATCYSQTHKRTEPCNSQNHPCPLQEVKNTKKPVTMEHTHYDKDGNSRNVEIHGYPIFNDAGEVIQMIEYALDVTDRRLAEDALRKNEAKFRKFFNNSPFMMFSCNEDGTITDVNRKWQEETGYSMAESVGQNIDFLMTLESAERATAMRMPKTFSGDFNRDIPFQYIKKDGNVIDVILNSNATTDPAGNKLNLSIVQDVTERRKAHEYQNRLKSAIEQSSDGIVITDPDGKIQYINPAFERITGYQKKESVGKKYVYLQSKSPDWPKGRFISKVFHIEKTSHGKFTNKRKDGTEFEEEVTITPILSKQGKLLNYVVVKRDVTEKIRLESIAEAANLMDNIGFVFSGIRHEIGNPINTIKMTLNVIQNNLDNFSTDRIDEFMKRALVDVGRVEYLLNALRNFSLFESPKIDKVTLHSFMEKFITLIADDFEKKGITINTNFSAKAGRGLTDSRALQQVMLNILINAADSLTDTEDPMIQININKSGRLILVTVEDNGCGMNPEQRQKLFKPFYTTKPHGTGLGLVIVRKMLTKMNSSIEISSTEKKGTKVTITLPEG